MRRRGRSIACQFQPSSQAAALCEILFCRRVKCQNHVPQRRGPNVSWTGRHRHLMMTLVNRAATMWWREQGTHSLSWSGSIKCPVFRGMARPDIFEFFEGGLWPVRSVRLVATLFKTLVGPQERWANPDAPSTANRKVFEGDKGLEEKSAEIRAASPHFATHSNRRMANFLN